MSGRDYREQVNGKSVAQTPDAGRAERLGQTPADPASGAVSRSRYPPSARDLPDCVPRPDGPPGRVGSRIPSCASIVPKSRAQAVVTRLKPGVEIPIGFSMYRAAGIFLRAYNFPEYGAAVPTCPRVPAERIRRTASRS